MGCLKCFWKHKSCILDKRDENKIFQDWIFPTDGHDNFLQICDTHPKVNLMDTIMLLKSKD